MANVTITRESENFVCRNCKNKLRIADTNEGFETDLSNIDELINLLIDFKTDIQAISFKGKVK